MTTAARASSTWRAPRARHWLARAKTRSTTLRADSTADDLSAVAPGCEKHDPDLELMDDVFDHPAVPGGGAGRHATCADGTTRHRVANHPRCPAPHSR